MESVPPRRLGIAILAAWSLVALVAALQAVATSRLTGLALGRTIVARVAIVPLWAVATPFVLRSARRFPVTGEARAAALAHVALHLAAGIAFVVAANALIRVPLLGAGWDAFARSMALGLTEYFPTAVVVYAVLVAVGHALHHRPRAASAPDPIPAAAATPAPPPAAIPECLTIRQWDRTHLVRLADIEWIEAEDNYVVVHAAGKPYRTRERIADVERRLDATRFVRIHRSTIVHVVHIRELQPLGHGDQAVVLRCGKVLRVARSRGERLGEVLGAGC